MPYYEHMGRRGLYLEIDMPRPKRIALEGKGTGPDGVCGFGFTYVGHTPVLVMSNPLAAMSAELTRENAGKMRDWLDALIKDWDATKAKVER